MNCCNDSCICHTSLKSHLMQGNNFQSHPIWVLRILSDFSALVLFLEHSSGLFDETGYNGVQYRNEPLTSNFWTYILVWTICFSKRFWIILFHLLLPVSTPPSLKCTSKQLPASSPTTASAPAELFPSPPPPLVPTPPPPSPPAPPPPVAPPPAPSQPEAAVVESSAAAEVDAPQEEDSKEEEVRAEVSCRYFLSALHTVFL